MVELIADDRHLDLADGEADIAVRGGSSPEGAGVRRAGSRTWLGACTVTGPMPRSTASLLRSKRSMDMRSSA